MSIFSSQKNSLHTNSISYLCFVAGSATSHTIHRPVQLKKLCDTEWLPKTINLYLYRTDRPYKIALFVNKIKSIITQCDDCMCMNWAHDQVLLADKHISILRVLQIHNNTIMISQQSNRYTHTVSCDILK